jgi:diguanylate cyclase (GGDEF)-like protein
MLEVVADPQQTLSQGDPQDRWISITRRILGGSFGLLVATACLVVVAGQAQPLGIIVLALVGVVGGAAWFHRRAVAAGDRARRAEAETFARILQGLSRSVSPAAIIEAMLGDLGRVTAADHCVVVRFEAGSDVPIATLVSMHPGVPSTTTVLPPTAFSQADPAAQDRATEQLAARAESAFGIGNTLAVPLRHEGLGIGAIILSRRSTEPWPAATQRVLAAAAIEASAALSRVDSTRAVEARASTDALTGLPNRRYFEEFCSLLGRRRRSADGLDVGVLMVDIDWFKRVNDTFGHGVGDEVLRAVGGAIAAAVREGDVPARFGGEEFAVLLRHATAPIALEVAERVRLAVGQLDLREWRVPGVSVSVGVAVGSRPDVPINELLVAADRALYRAKRGGRNQVVAA